MKNSLLLIALIFVSASFSLAQSQEKVYQFSGMIVDADSLKPIPFVRVQINHSRNGTLTNEEGFYSIPVSENDTLYFGHIAYKPSKLVVKDYLRQYKGNKSQYVYVVNYLYSDTSYVQTVYIFPYDTPEELRTAAINMDTDPNSLIARARENLDPKVLHSIMESLPVSGNERLMVARQRYYTQYQNQNLIPTAGLDPISAVRMLQYIVDKAKRRKNKDLNYWE
ncbi:MAG: carboxypeptidase-like regulatory domain-containing protein [Bacteroidia bacterium]|nr:carboxypeptidase-like regulatory domain-containing protein [Bacteroidia bacterium]